jgi:hypothetical protein
MRPGRWALALAFVSACDPEVYVGYEAAPIDQGDAAPVSPVPWQAHHEDGTMSEWLSDGFGNFGSSAASELRVSSEFAHAGSYALVATIFQSGDATLDQAVIWRTVALRAGVYSAWYYFPATVLGTHWVIMKLSSENNGDRFDLDVYSVPGEGMRLRLWEHDDVGWISEPAAIELPVGAWVHVEAELVAAPAPQGRLIVRQDGVQLFDTGQRSTMADERVKFFVGTAAFSVEPVPARVFIDDVAIFPAAP